MRVRITSINLTDEDRKFLDDKSISVTKFVRKQIAKEREIDIMIGRKNYEL